MAYFWIVTSILGLLLSHSASAGCEQPYREVLLAKLRAKGITGEREEVLGSTDVMSLPEDQANLDKWGALFPSEFRKPPPGSHLIVGFEQEGDITLQLTLFVPRPDGSYTVKTCQLSSLDTKSRPETISENPPITGGGIQSAAHAAHEEFRTELKLFGLDATKIYSGATDIHKLVPDTTFYFATKISLDMEALRTNAARKIVQDALKVPGVDREKVTAFLTLRQKMSVTDMMSDRRLMDLYGIHRKIAKSFGHHKKLDDIIKARVQELLQ